MEYQKVKSVAKNVRASGPELDKLILETMRTVADVVGATLGPGGRPVLIERFEHDLPPLVTKDGVTVFRSLGFSNSTKHCVMEVARDASVRTATEAGDGTTTATILSEAIVRHMHQFCKNNPRISPQRVVRALEQTFRNCIEPAVRALSRKADLEDDFGRALLRAVAKVSANGDSELADAIMQCFDITGDDGNVTIVEANGPSRYEVEAIDGFAIGVGYDRSAGKFAPAFINDPGTQRCLLQKPVFLLYHGRLSEIQTIKLLMEAVGDAWQSKEGFNHNVVVVATGFSESVLANLAANFAREDCINVFPLLVPESAQSNGQLQFLEDLSAVTSATILDPIQRPVEHATLQDLGPGVDYFECSRFRSSVIGHTDDDLLAMRVDQLRKQLENPESQLDAIWTRERMAKLAGGIAKLKVIGASNGEMKEKRDRADDAVCAVRGAIQHGCLPGGGWTLLKLCQLLPSNQINDEILRPAFLTPFERLAQNCGVIEPEEFQAILAPILQGIKDHANTTGEPVVYDFLDQKHVNPYTDGILDSTPAVLEAIRTSIANASVLGTLGGTVVFERDSELERSEARATANWMRSLEGPSNDEI